MKTEETNKLIAEFMEHKPTFEVYIDNVLTPLERPIKNYHSDWNWLMEVVEKIESLSKEQKVINWSRRNKNIFDFKLTESKIKAVYNACVTFIEWYNENSAKNN